MPYRAMALAAASIMTLSGSALAQKTDPTTDAKNLNTSRSNIYRDGATTTPGGGAGTTNDPLRMGGAGGGKGAVGRMNPVQPVHKKDQ